MSIAATHAYRFKFLKSEKWQTVRIEALAREGGKCQICGEESIHNDAHHIWYPENIYETRQEQLVILCRPCHDFTHAMLPECKTRDEQKGRSEWTKLRNAIITWRQEKISIFSKSEGIKIIVPSDLRASIIAIKQDLYNKLNLKKTITKNDIGEAFGALGRLSEPPDTKA